MALESLVRDARFAVRSLRKTPAYTLVALITLTLGIGANTAIWSVVDGVVLRPLDFPEPDRLVRVWSAAPAKGLPRTSTSFPRFELLAAQQEVFSHLAASTEESFALGGVEPPEELAVLRVSGDFFPALGVAPALGRGFSAEENREGGAAVVVLAHDLWQRRFGGDPGIVGDRLLLSGEPYTVIGVMDDLGFPYDKVQAFVPRVFEPAAIEPVAVKAAAGYLHLTARLHDGVGLDAAQANLDVLAQAYRAAYPDLVDVDFGLFVLPFKEELVGELRTSSALLAAAVGLVLLIACANVAHLVLARFAGRRREVALRAALGARPATIWRQFLLESFGLAGLAGVCGTGLAFLFLDLLQPLVAEHLPRAGEIALDPRVLAATAGVTLLTGFLLALPPALQALSTDASEVLGESARGAAGGRGGRRGVLVVAEVTFAVALITVAGLLVLSFYRLQSVDPGFVPEGVTVAHFTLPLERYPGPPDSRRFFLQLAEGLEARPTVDSAAVVFGLPFDGDLPRTPFGIAGEDPKPFNQLPLAGFRMVTPSYLETLRIPLRAGRGFTERDMEPEAPQVLLVNETLARNRFGGDALGERLTFGREQQYAREIIGVVADVRSLGLGEPFQEEVFFPVAQGGWAAASVVVRSDLASPAVIAEIREVAAGIDPELPLVRPGPFVDVVAGSLGERRLVMSLLLGFAALALLLALVGIYSVISYSLSQRHGEIGVRMALGASARQVIAMVLREGLLLLGLGLGLGLAAAAGGARLVAASLYGVGVLDPVVFLAVPALFLTCGLLACLLPARRAIRVDPSTALRAGTG